MSALEPHRGTKSVDYQSTIDPFSAKRGPGSLKSIAKPLKPVKTPWYACCGRNKVAQAPRHSRQLTREEIDFTIMERARKTLKPEKKES